MQHDAEGAALEALDRLYDENSEGMKRLAEPDWRALCEELYLALCRPQRPSGDLLDRAYEALYPLGISAQRDAEADSQGL